MVHRLLYSPILFAVVFLGNDPAWSGAGEPEKAPGPSIHGEEKKPVIADWGIASDVAGDCRFDLKDGDLTITVPGDIRGHWAELHPGALQAPRVLNCPAGDFTMEVKIKGGCTPLSDLAQDYAGACAQSGLMIMQDPKNFVSLTRASYEAECSSDNPPGKRIWRQWSVSAQFAVSLNGKTRHLKFPEPAFFKENEPVWLRLIRRGNEIIPAWSGDGEKWTEGPSYAMAVQEKGNCPVLAGVIATSGATTEYAPAFSGFRLTSQGNPGTAERRAEAHDKKLIPPAPPVPQSEPR